MTVFSGIFLWFESCYFNVEHMYDCVHMWNSLNQSLYYFLPLYLYLLLHLLSAAVWLVLLPCHWNAFAEVKNDLPGKNISTWDGIGQPTSWNSLFLVFSNATEFLLSSSVSDHPLTDFYGILVLPFSAFSYLSCWYYQNYIVSLSHSFYFNW